MNFNPGLRYRFMLAILTVFVLSSCEKVVDLPGPAYRRQAVLTGLLEPDSLISIQLSYTRKSTDTSYESVGNAQVTFFENGQFIGAGESLPNGRYRLNRKPIPGNTYRVVAVVSGYGQLEAEDKLPAFRQASISMKPPNSKNPNTNPDFELTWQPEPFPAFYWLDTHVRESDIKMEHGCSPNASGVFPPGCDFVFYTKTRFNYLMSTSFHADRFNGYADTSIGNYVFSLMLRFDPDKLPEANVTFPFTVFNSYPKTNKREVEEGIYFDFIAAGPSYDAYLKTVIRAYLNRVTDSEEAVTNPFAEVSPVYTNVRNGLGIFGAFNRQRFHY